MTNAQSHTTSSLVPLFHHRWAVPALAAFHGLGGGAKLVTLCSKVGAGRDSMQRTLAALCELGLTRRNPGYGHPMRPEYLLTPKGRRVAKPCAALWKTIETLDIQRVALKKWALPALGALGQSTERFGQISNALGGISPRALAQTLQDLQKIGVIERRLKDGAPPYAEYRATKAGRNLLAKVNTLENAATSSVR
jgi:DNA-binding HxlR family transcriptional regulator